MQATGPLPCLSAQLHFTIHSVSLAIRMSTPCIKCARLLIFCARSELECKHHQMEHRRRRTICSCIRYVIGTLEQTRTSYQSTHSSFPDQGIIPHRDTQQPQLASHFDESCPMRCTTDCLGRVSIRRGSTLRVYDNLKDHEPNHFVLCSLSMYVAFFSPRSLDGY